MPMAPAEIPAEYSNLLKVACDVRGHSVFLDAHGRINEGGENLHQLVEFLSGKIHAAHLIAIRSGCPQNLGAGEGRDWEVCFHLDLSLATRLIQISSSRTRIKRRLPVLNDLSSPPAIAL